MATSSGSAEEKKRLQTLKKWGSERAETLIVCTSMKLHLTWMDATPQRQCSWSQLKLKITRSQLNPCNLCKQFLPLVYIVMALTSISYLIMLNLTWVKETKKKLSSKDLHYVQTNPITLHLNNSNFRRDLKYLIFLFLYFIFFISYFSNTLLILYETETFCSLCTTMEGKFYFTNNSVLQSSWVAYYIIEYIEWSAAKIFLERAWMGIGGRKWRQCYYNQIKLPWNQCHNFVNPTQNIYIVALLNLWPSNPVSKSNFDRPAKQNCSDQRRTPVKLEHPGKT